MRLQQLDILKVVSIIAIVLYHSGICGYGFLGVDVFLVLAGFFTAKSTLKSEMTGCKFIFSFISERVFRLLPLIIIAGAVCLLWGYNYMLPDDYENTAQSVVASNLFSNNYLQAHTTKFYWNISNLFRPLMHTWFVGLIMQYYILVSIILLLVNKATIDLRWRKPLLILFICVLTLVSLTLYCYETDESIKFYYLQYRFYEFGCGMILFYLSKNKTAEGKSQLFPKTVYFLAYTSIAVLLFVDVEFVTPNIRRLITILVTTLLIWSILRKEETSNTSKFHTILAKIGKASYSIFIWHQIVFALTRYSFTIEIQACTPFAISFTLISLLSWLSYHFVEKMKQTQKTIIAFCTLFAITTAFSLYLYANAGVVRDVPELDITKSTAHRGLWAEYCDKGYCYDRDFSSSSMPKWLIIGDSFGRDFVNIIRESKIADSVEISYSDLMTFADKVNRFQKADIVFISINGFNEGHVSLINSYCTDNCRVIIIGEKNFGYTNGQIYRLSNRRDYHNTSTKINESYHSRNKHFRTLYGEKFLDLLSFVTLTNGNVRVFTPDGHFISHDCSHLTRAGAKFYAERIDWDYFLLNK